MPYQNILVAVCVSTAGLVAGPSQALQTLVDNGPSGNRIDLVFLGDGYTQANLDAGTYDQHISKHLGYLFDAGSYLTDPFPRYSRFFNVHKVDVVSAQSGADKPPQNVFVDTALDASYWWDGSTERLLSVNQAKAQAALTAGLVGSGIHADMKLVTVNDTKYGGAGGGFPVFAGGNVNADEVALHEQGHSFADLADEYGGEGAYSGGEPAEPNVTKNASGAKWDHWMGFDDPRGSNLDIGVFQGARYFDQGLYRPSNNSKMRALNNGFDAVSRERFIHRFYDVVDPLDAWLQDAVVYDMPVWVDVIDPAVVAVKWFVDGQLLEGAGGEVLDLARLGFGPGTYDVEALAYDTVVDHAFTGGLLDLVRTDLEQLQQQVSWTVTIVPEPATGLLLLAAAGAVALRRREVACRRN